MQFGPAVTHAAGTTPVSVASGDFDGDSHLDLVCANTDSNDITVLFGAGDGSFGAAPNGRATFVWST